MVSAPTSRFAGLSAAALLLGVLAAASLSACGQQRSAVPPTSGATPDLPPVSGVFDYQLGGASDAVDVDGEPVRPDVVVRDSTAPPLEGAYSICYLNGFQTQPDAAEHWRTEHPDLLLRDEGATPVADPDWPDEFVLDPTTPRQREGILAVVGPWIDACASAGFQAVEFDNLDSWTRFDGVDRAGALELAQAYVDRAHRVGLAAAQKNTAELGTDGRDLIGFDFAIAESCAVWGECGGYGDVYGDHVLDIEYPEELADAGMTFADVCASSDRAPLTLLRDRDLVPPGAEGHVFDWC